MTLRCFLESARRKAVVYLVTTVLMTIYLYGWDYRGQAEASSWSFHLIAMGGGLLLVVKWLLTPKSAGGAGEKPKLPAAPTDSGETGIFDCSPPSRAGL